MQRPAADPATAPPPYVVRNNAALVPWGFLAVWMSLLAIMTWMTIRDVLNEGLAATGWTPFVIAAFWLFGLMFSIQVARMKRVRATFAAGRVEIVRRGLFDAARWEGPVRSVADAMVEQGTDSDGDPYFRCLMTIPGLDRVTIAEGHDRSAIEAVRDRVNAIRAAAT